VAKDMKNTDDNFDKAIEFLEIRYKESLKDAITEIEKEHLINSFGTKIQEITEREKRLANIRRSIKKEDV
jgi:hypothetical protein